jgi:hypothetical protein
VDFYDSDALLQKILSSDYGHLVKTGSIMSKDQINRLPDRLFALVMEKDGHVIKKYACPDAANTALSLGYFDHNWKDLPLPAAKTAAANLATACDWYGIDKPKHLEKISFLGSAALMTGLSIPQIKPTLNKARIRKQQYLANAGIPPMPKMGSASLNPYIKVTKDDLTFNEQYDIIKAASTQPGLALNSLTDIEKAAKLYKDRAVTWDLKQKVAFCCPLVKRASVLGLKKTLPEEIQIYGNTKRASDDHIMAHLESRKNALGKDYIKYAARLDELLDESTEDQYVEKIGQADAEFGIKYHTNMADPWKVIYGQIKTAEYLFRDGEMKVTGSQLKKLANSPEYLQGKFKKELVNAFCKEPVRIFSSLPLEQKKAFMLEATKF